MTPTDTWTGGLPTTTLPRIMVFVAGPPITMPLVLPTAVFSSMELLSPFRMPIPKSSLGVAKPFPLVSFHRSELLLPRIHMPPHGKPGIELPFLTEMLPAIKIRDAVAATRMPD